MTRVDYDRIAPTYDERYHRHEGEGASGVLDTVSRLTNELGARRVLEVGCGTAYWLATLAAEIPKIVGVDLSAGMLARARERSSEPGLVRATASRLPFRTGVFDVVFCVNAIHHFDDARRFVTEAAGCLRHGGALLVIGMDPSARRDRWYLYDYFPGTLEADLARYPSAETIASWMREAGFDAVETGIAQRIAGEHVGREVLAEPTLQKNGTSQLVLLSDEAYRAGRRRIDEAIERGEERGEPAIFPVDISLVSVLGRVPSKDSPRSSA